MTKMVDLGAMTVDELWQLHEELSEVLATRLTSEKRELEKRLAQLQREEAAGDLQRPLPADGLEPRQRRAYPRVLPKYRNPANPEETWSGRGKQPRWVAVALKAGHHIDEFLISSFEPSRDRR
ncbi:H-NS family nucleoid-associated regulatory protein [Bradyrhizobium ganzhouense]|uniref:H-NS histone family protein n=1 Tax=Bradyrhizobium ganzhouense TaxID=1179767 RepID=UPI003CFA355E